MIIFFSPTVCNVTYLHTKELYKSKLLENKKKEELMAFTSIFFGNDWNSHVGSIVAGRRFRQ